VFLAHRFRVDILNRARKRRTRSIFPKQADDKGDHSFENADFKIVGVINWE